MDMAEPMTARTPAAAAGRFADDPPADDPPVAEWGKGADGRSYGLVRRDEDFPRAALERLEELGRGVAWRDGGDAPYPPAVAVLPVGEAGWLSVVLRDAGADAAGRPHTLALHATYHPEGHPSTPARLPVAPVLLHAGGVRTGSPNPFAAPPDAAPAGRDDGEQAATAKTAGRWSKALFAAALGFVLGVGFAVAVGTAVALSMLLAAGGGSVGPISVDAVPVRGEVRDSDDLPPLEPLPDDADRSRGWFGR